MFGPNNARICETGYTFICQPGITMVHEVLTVASRHLIWETLFLFIKSIIFIFYLNWSLFKTFVLVFSFQVKMKSSYDNIVQARTNLQILDGKWKTLNIWKRLIFFSTNFPAKRLDSMVLYRPAPKNQTKKEENWQNMRK